jgi:DNA invertase Pin-like site-specific DNA recombinase
MSKGNFVAYYRVSTAKQGASGLGLEAQRKAVMEYLHGRSWKLAAEFTEVESGKNDDGRQLAKAIKACRVFGAKLVIAKLDRLSRDAHFLLGLQRQACHSWPAICRKPTSLRSGSWRSSRRPSAR